MFDKTRPLSWSQLWLFENKPEEWYRKYVLGEKQHETKEMKFGKEIGERLASDPTFLPEVIRYQDFELNLVAKWKKIPLIGFLDTSNIIEERRMREYKTGKAPWTQSRADKHGQFDMYLLLVYIVHKIKPEEMTCHLDWLQTRDVDPEHDSLEDFLKNKSDSTIDFFEQMEVKSFLTKRTMTDILKFATRLEKAWIAMEKYCLNHS